MADLFKKEVSDGDSRVAGDAGPQPLAERMRPKTLEAVIGQDHLLGEGGALRALLEAHALPSLIFYGPPGCGKTTLARIIADQADKPFKQISAIFTGVADLKKIFEQARLYHQQGKQLVLFVDEIHRFNKSQQDGFLPYMEEGSLVLIGATTENPSFALNSALLSRARVCTLKSLDEAALEKLYERLQENADTALNLNEEARNFLIAASAGDARFFLNLAEQIKAQQKDGAEPLSREALEALIDRRAAFYDKGGEQHYNLISALHKAVRASDPDAALYWLARMLSGGEDPLYIARRVLRMASEDIGLADPMGVVQAEIALKTYERLGSPEGELGLAQAVVYLATAPKSNAVYKAYKAAMRHAKETSHIPPQKHSMNAPTKWMKQEGYSDNYRYDHDAPDAFSGQNHFPEALGRPSYYQPVSRGFERDIEKRLNFWAKRRGDNE